jgi:hypothetical protein
MGGDSHGHPKTKGPIKWTRFNNTVFNSNPEIEKFEYYRMNLHKLWRWDMRTNITMFFVAGLIPLVIWQLGRVEQQDWAEDEEFDKQFKIVNAISFKESERKY